MAEHSKEQTGNFTCFTHTACEYFPCHRGVAPEEFNCLFCYCPLYALGKDCGGNFVILENGVKDCSSCLIPHKKENYGWILEHFGEIQRLIQKKA